MSHKKGFGRSCVHTSRTAGLKELHDSEVHACKLAPIGIVAVSTAIANSRAVGLFDC
jgi:hypothetical protein